MWKKYTQIQGWGAPGSMETAAAAEEPGACPPEDMRSQITVRDVQGRIALKGLPVMKKQCASCPFRKGGLEDVRPLLEERAMSEASPICHSTGTSDVTPRSKKIHHESFICRGARDFQLNLFYKLGVILEATDSAWDAKCLEMGIK